MDGNGFGAVPGQRVWIERLLLVVVVALYVWAFTPDNPNGDGAIYIREIGTGSPVWNPNHLLFQPIGLLFAKVCGALGLGWSTFTVLKVLSGLAAVSTVVLFHATLCSIGVSSSVRLAASFALFFSGYFLSLALAEEFFVIQMPLLAAILLAAVRWIEQRSTWSLIVIGVLLAVVTGVQVNNGLLAVSLGGWAAWEARGRSGAAWRALLSVWGPGILVGIPLVIVPYLWTSRHEGLVTWLTSYQGQGGNDLGALYGISLTPGGVVKSAATLIYGFVQTFAGLGDLGTAVEAVVMRRGFDFRPNMPLLVSTLLLFVILGVSALGLFWWWWRHGRREALGRLAGVWLGAYALFNFLWVDSADQFWAPVLPVMWLMIVRWSSGTATVSGWRRPATMLAVVASLLALVNTGTVSLYRSFTALDANRAALQQLLRPGDLVITTGWDDVVWLAPTPTQPFDRVTLLPLALKGRAASVEMARLPERVSTHLATGGRVLVARVFDLDREARPWEQMARLGWPRSRVVSLFGEFERTPVSEIGSVRIYQIGPGRGSAPTP